METKNAIRTLLREKRNALTLEEHTRYSDIIIKKLLSLGEFLASENLLLYSSYAKEVETATIMTQAWEQGKKVYCPKVLSGHQMEFYSISSPDDLSEGYKGIREPKDSELFCADSKNVLMIVPMTGFDQNRNRLGYGKGYYDRYLENRKNIITIGLAFECQKWDGKLPVSTYDIPLNKIITEKNIYE